MGQLCRSRPAAIDPSLPSVTGDLVALVAQVTAASLAAVPPPTPGERSRQPSGDERPADPGSDPGAVWLATTASQSYFGGHSAQVILAAREALAEYGTPRSLSRQDLEEAVVVAMSVTTYRGGPHLSLMEVRQAQGGADLRDRLAEAEEVLERIPERLRTPWLNAVAETLGQLGVPVTPLPPNHLDDDEAPDGAGELFDSLASVAATRPMETAISLDAPSRTPTEPAWVLDDRPEHLDLNDPAVALLVRLDELSGPEQTTTPELRAEYASSAWGWFQTEYPGHADLNHAEPAARRGRRTPRTWHPRVPPGTAREADPADLRTPPLPPADAVPGRHESRKLAAGTRGSHRDERLPAADTAAQCNASRTSTSGRGRGPC